MVPDQLHGEWKVVCDECGVAMHPGAVTRHKKSFHRGGDEVVMGRFNCKPPCTFSCARAEHLKQHQKPNIKINIVRRPSSSVHFLGNYLPDGSILPGDLQFLDTLVLGDFKRRVKQGTLAGFPKTIIFFRQADTFKCFSGFPWLINTCVRSSENLVMVNSHLLNVLGKQSLDSSPWAMNHASMTPTDEAFLMTRKNEYSLWLTTPRMLLGELGKLRAYFTFFQE